MIVPHVIAAENGAEIIKSDAVDVRIIPDIYKIIPVGKIPPQGGEITYRSSN